VLFILRARAKNDSTLIDAALVLGSTMLGDPAFIVFTSARSGMAVAGRRRPGSVTNEQRGCHSLDFEGQPFPQRSAVEPMELSIE
jgi:hypothetical protein